MTYLNLRILLVAGLFCAICAVQADRLRGLGELAFAMDTIERNYVKPVARQHLYRAAIKGMAGSLDPFSSYIPPEQFAPFEAQLQQEFGGLGIIIEKPPGERYLRIVTSLYDSPAYRAGITGGDRLLEVDGISLADAPIEKASLNLRGPPDTQVRLKVQAAGDDAPVRELTVRRAIIETESVTGDRRLENGQWVFLMEADPRIAYIRVEIFGEKTTDELRRALASVKGKAQGLILDLRDNAGGLLPTAIQLCDMFLEDGPIVSTVGRERVEMSSYDAQPGVELADAIPIVVLVNQDSASASEVTAGCLQDRGRAVIMGSRTFGKGSVQNIIELENGTSALRLTSAHYLPPSGRNIHRELNATDSDDWGVRPNPGMEVAVDDATAQRLLKRLQDRGHPRSARSAEVPPSLDEATTSVPGDPASIETTPESIDAGDDPSLVVDPALLKATHYLRDQLAAK